MYSYARSSQNVQVVKELFKETPMQEMHRQNLEIGVPEGGSCQRGSVLSADDVLLSVRAERNFA